MTGLAVVGTGTGVGKTVVTAGLVGWLRERGRAAVGVKPCQTGHPPDDDAGVVQAACETEAAATCLRRLKPALAPAVAAEEADADLSYDEIHDGCRAAVGDTEVGVVEGIGGLRVPLADGQEVLDLFADLGLPAVVVARSELGTLNHSALTVSALEDRGLDVVGVVLNEYEGATVAERTNPDVLAEMTGQPVWTVPPLSVEPSGYSAALRDHLPAAVPEATQPLAGADT